MTNSSNIREFTSLRSLAVGIELYIFEGYTITGIKDQDKLILDMIRGEAKIPNKIATHQLVRKVQNILHILARGGFVVVLRANHETHKLTLLVDCLL